MGHATAPAAADQFNLPRGTCHHNLHWGEETERMQLTDFQVAAKPLENCVEITCKAGSETVFGKIGRATLEDWLKKDSGNNYQEWATYVSDRIHVFKAIMASRYLAEEFNTTKDGNSLIIEIFYQDIRNNNAL